MTSLPSSFSLRRAVAIGLASLFLLAIGCGKAHESSISGTVTLDGKPLTTGVVSFYPLKGGPMAYGNIQSNGAYKIVTGGTRGLPSGEYRVAVVANETAANTPGVEMMGKRITPEKYATPEKSGLKFNVQPGGNRFDISLQSQGEP
jgi:hypothetical protein